MTPKPNPFSLYDFLGYFTPGALVLYFIVAMHGGEAGISNLATEPKYYPAFILIAYTLGHLLSYLSSITIEQYAVITLGYPSKYLLAPTTTEYFKVDSPGANIVRFILYLLMLPVSLSEFILGDLLGMRARYVKILDPFLVSTIKEKCDALFFLYKVSGNTTNSSDTFRFVYHYAVEYAPNHYAKMQNYVALYGFVRTVTFIFVMLFWKYIYDGYYGSSGVRYIEIGVLASVSLFFYLSFVKFYRRFTLEAFMAVSIVVDNHPSGKTK